METLTISDRLFFVVHMGCCNLLTNYISRYILVCSVMILNDKMFNYAGILIQFSEQFQPETNRKLGSVTSFEPAPI